MVNDDVFHFVGISLGPDAGEQIIQDGLEAKIWICDLRPISFGKRKMDGRLHIFRLLMYDWVPLGKECVLAVGPLWTQQQ